MRPRRPHERRLRTVAVVLAALAVLLVGCDVMTLRSPSPRPTRLVATPEPPPEPTPTELEEVPTLRPDPSGTGPDLLDAANGLADLASYRVIVTTRGLVPATPAGGAVAMDSTLVQGEDPAARFRMTGVAGFAGGRLEAVVIGEQAWLKEGSAAWVKSPGGAADFDAAFTTLSPIDLTSEFESLSGAIRRTGVETRNGRRTIHYHADAGDPGATEAGLSRGTIDAWFAASGGYLVGLEIDGTWDLDGTPARVTLGIDVTRVNDPLNRVVPPV
jgi:hypothetical protein